MPVDVKWKDEAKQTILQTYSGHVVLDDYYKAIDAFCELASSVPYTVHSIMDRSDIISSKGSYLQVMRYANTKLPDNVGIRIVIKPSMMTKVLVDIGKRITPHLIDQVYNVGSREEAEAILQEIIGTSSVS